MRIVNTDNFDGDYPNEQFVLGPMAEKNARAIARELNEVAGYDSPRYYKVVENDYQLVPGFTP